MAIWKTYRIADIISEISDEKFVLPVIQRSLVWTEDKMELLFDTLLKGDSFGGVMIIEEEKETKPLFNYRPFTKDGDLIASRQVDKGTNRGKWKNNSVFRFVKTRTGESVIQCSVS